jgi:hypothetical protein
MGLELNKTEKIFCFYKQHQNNKKKNLKYLFLSRISLLDYAQLEISRSKKLQM